MTPPPSTENPGSTTAERTLLPISELRWSCSTDELPFSSTEEVEPVAGVVGQDDAVDALAFGLEIHAAGQNIFVRGLSGTGRLSLVRRLVAEIRPQCPLAHDLCYVHNFERPERPRLLTLPRGQGDLLHRRMEELIEALKSDLPEALGSDAIKARRKAFEQSAQAELQAVTQPFEDEVRAAGLALVQMQVAPNNTQLVVLPVVDGNPVPLDQVEVLVRQGKISEPDFEQLKARMQEYSERLGEVAERANEVTLRTREALAEFFASEVRLAIGPHVLAVERSIKAESVAAFLETVVEDIVRRFSHGRPEDLKFAEAYRVNAVLSHSGEGCPVVVENTPTLQALLGTIEVENRPGEAPRSNHMMIRGGSLLASDGGFLILDAREVLEEPGAWKALVRTLRTGRLEIGASDPRMPWFKPALKPDPIDIHAKVILIGDAGIYHMLDAYDPDFAEQFKVLSDFDSVITRDESGLRMYAGVLARIIAEEGLPHFECSAIAAIAEHGARIAERRDRLTARFGRLSDIAREAAFLARKDQRSLVVGEDVLEAIRRTKRRADLPARRFRQFVADGTIHLMTRGRAIGQVNGLAVTHAGPLTYGFPARISATIGPGSAGMINIEREANLSGAIHTKGFYILGGLLRHLLRTAHPLAFSASVAFEQSYGGIDGDSASGAEMCCLLSALTDVPLRQDLAMTGAIDQVGHILPIGAANEKIEGFYDTCCDLGGLSGTQGVIVPRANAGDLMLRADVVDACIAGRFRIHAVETIHEALELFTGIPAGQRDAENSYPEGTLLAQAVEQAWRYWERASASPMFFQEVEEETAEEPAGDEPAEEN